MVLIPVSVISSMGVARRSTRRDVGPVERRVVVRVQRQPLGPERERAGLEHLGHRRVVHDFVDLGPDEVRGRLVGFFVDHQVVEAALGEHEPALLPGALESGGALGGGDLQRRGHAGRVGDAAARVPPAPPPLLVVLLPHGGKLPVERAVRGRDGELGGALEHGQVPGLLGDHRDGLDARGAGADHADPQAGEVHRLVRPVAGVQRPPGEAVSAREHRLVGRRQAPHRGDQVPGVRLGPVLGAHRPGVGVLVVGRADHLGVEGEVLAQLQPVRHQVQVLEDDRLARVALVQRPFLLQLGQERVGVVHALGVAPRARVAVPVPRAADALACLEAVHGEAHLAQLVHHVHAGEAGSDNNRVQPVVGSINGRICLGLRHRCLLASSQIDGRAARPEGRAKGPSHLTWTLLPTNIVCNGPKPPT